MNHFLPTISGHLFNPDLMVRLALVLMHFLWQGTLCGLAVLVAGRLMQRASSGARYRVFVVLLCFTAALPAVTYWWTERAREETFAPAAARPSVVTVAVTAAVSRSATIPRTVATAPVTAQPISDLRGTPRTSREAVVAPRTLEPTIATAPSAGGREGWARFVVCAYFIGVLAMFGRLLVALWGGRRLRCSASPIEEGPLAEVVVRQAKRIGHKAVPVIAWCGRTSVPVVVGILRPMILLPAMLATGFDPVALEALIAHELAHLRRYDPLVNLAQRVIEAALFFHPAIWYVSRQVSAERENACDDLVLLAGWPRVQYADALLQMAEWSAAVQGIRSRATAGTVLAASGGESSQLRSRVLRLLEIGDGPRMSLPRGGVFLLAAAGVLLFATSPLIHAVTNQEKAPSAAQSATLARVLAAWQKRQEHVKSFHFAWETRINVPKGFHIYSGGPPGEIWLPTHSIVVAKSTEFTVPESEWWGQGDERFRYGFPIVEYDAADHWHPAARVRLIRDGRIRSRLTVPSSPASKPWSTIWRTLSVKNSLRHPFAAGEFNLIPLELALRPLSETSEWSPQNCRIESEDDVVGKVHCIKLVAKIDYGTATLWLDPKRDYVVVKQARQFWWATLDIEYQRDPQHGWIPSRWTWRFPGSAPLPPGTATKDAAHGSSGPKVVQATVTRYAIDEKFDTDPFATTEPAGALVYDLTDDGSTDLNGEEHPVHPPQNARAILDRIAANWLKRQTHVKSFQFTWKRAWRVERMTADWAPVSPMDRICTACGEGSLFALELRTPGWSRSLELQSKYPGRSHRGKTAFDGATTRSFGMGAPLIGSAFIRSGFDPGDLSETDADCFWLALLPADARFTRLDPAKFGVLSENARIGDTLCVLVEANDPAQPHTRLWLDPAREDIVLRKQWNANSWGGVERVDFSYRANPEIGWIPSAWEKTIVSAGGTIPLSSTDTVTESSLNQPISRAEFKVELPTNQYIEDKDSEATRETKAREAAAAVCVGRWAKPLAKKPKTQPVYDPQFDARSDVDLALNAARATLKRVLIEFGGQGHPDCGKLYDSLRENAELSVRLQNGFVLVLVDTDYPDAGQLVYKQYVPAQSRNGVPALCVLNPDGTVLHNDDTADLKTGDDYDVDKLKVFLEKWSRRD